MKIAISGKGGVGKTTFAAFLIKSLQLKGKSVLAIDSDPDANLAQALGARNASEITPISEMKSLIEERTETKIGTMGNLFKMNPKVSDLPEKLSIDVDGVKLMVLGGVKAAEGGCICPQSVLLKVLVSHLILARNEVVVLDMEAGLEHLGRGTAAAVDTLIVVVHPTIAAMRAAERIAKLAGDLGIEDARFLGNQVTTKGEGQLLRNRFREGQILGLLPRYSELREDGVLSGPSGE